MVCPNAPEGKKQSLKERLEEANEHGLRTPHYEVLTESNSILMERPNLNALGHKLPMHRLASLMGLSTEQAQIVFEKSKDNKNTLQAAVRVLRLFKQPTEVVNAIVKAGDFFDEINPLTHLWLIGGQLKFLP